MSPEESRSDAVNTLSHALERRLALPVLACALLSVPAVLLSVWADGVWGRIGHWANWAAGLVLWAEWLLLILWAEDKTAWLRAHRWSTFVAALTVPAVVFTLGPAQLLRLVRVAMALPVIRLTRIIEAGGVLRRRLGLSGTTGSAVVAAAVVLCAFTVGVLLLDPESATRRFLADLGEFFTFWRTVAAAALLLAATAAILLLSRNARRRGREGPQPPP